MLSNGWEAESIQSAALPARSSSPNDIDMNMFKMHVYLKNSAFFVSLVSGLESFRSIILWWELVEFMAFWVHWMS